MINYNIFTDLNVFGEKLSNLIQPITLNESFACANRCDLSGNFYAVLGVLSVNYNPTRRESARIHQQMRRKPAKK